MSCPEPAQAVPASQSSMGSGCGSLHGGEGEWEPLDPVGESREGGTKPRAALGTDRGVSNLLGVQWDLGCRGPGTVLNSKHSTWPSSAPFGDDTTHGVLEIWNLEEVGSALCNAKDGKATASAPAEVTGLA